MPQELIDIRALNILDKLQAAGFDAYLVGGGVRDLLSGLHPKDFDVATNAKPEEIKKLFKNCRLIGRRFRLAHIYFGRHIIEVATFRGETEYCHVETGMILRDNTYGTIEEDAWRRDFTVNALFYNAKDKTIVDYVGGMDDLKKKKIRVIGDPIQRYHEDPVRMLRGLRLAAKLNFKLDNAAEEPIIRSVGLLQNISSARLFDEVSKWFFSGFSFAAFKLLREHGIFAVLFPKTEANLIKGANQQAYDILVHGFANTDQRIREQQHINPAFLFAVLLWWPLQKKLRYHLTDGARLFSILPPTITEVFQEQNVHVNISHYLRRIIKDIWMLQYRMAQMRKRKVTNIMRHPRFRAAYDFLLLRQQSGEKVNDVVRWWETHIKIK